LPLWWEKSQWQKPNSMHLEKGEEAGPCTQFAKWKGTYIWYELEAKLRSSLVVRTESPLLLPPPNQCLQIWWFELRFSWMLGRCSTT
jgi:hypothetical protein